MTKNWRKRIQHKFFHLFWSKMAYIAYLYIRIWIQRPHWIRIPSGSGSAALQVTEDIENEQGHKSNILDNWGITWNNLLFSKKDYSKFIAILVGFVPLKSCDFLGSRNKKTICRGLEIGFPGSDSLLSMRIQTTSTWNPGPKDRNSGQIRRFSSKAKKQKFRRNCAAYGK